MTLTSETSIPGPGFAARAAATKLASCERSHTISRFQAGDEDVLCGVCLVGIHWTAAGWRHNPDEIRELRRVAMEGAWPR